MKRIALVGDYSDAVLAHRAIGTALELACRETGVATAWDWIETDRVGPSASGLEGYCGLWLVPGSPYRDLAGALSAVRWARLGGRPFLGTCGGFQHALLELASTVPGLERAAHAEIDPAAQVRLIEPLACPLVEKTGLVRFRPGSQLHRAYGGLHAQEAYHCRYGLNSGYASALESAGLVFTAWDENGEIRAAELPSHPFFVGTLFQPERRSLQGSCPQLVKLFMERCQQVA
jgi:CTP synthase (UTP-ammonia lyase)